MDDLGKRFMTEKETFAYLSTFSQTPKSHFQAVESISRWLEPRERVEFRESVVRILGLG